MRPVTLGELPSDRPNNDVAETGSQVKFSGLRKTPPYKFASTRVEQRGWLRITTAAPDEAKAGLRRFYLYASVVISALAALVPVADLLRQFGGDALILGLPQILQAVVQLSVADQLDQR